MGNKKLRLLYVAQLLWERTDEEHTVTVNDIIAYLSGLDLSVERKTVYDDLDLLRLFGMDIVRTRTKTHNYYLGQRAFQLPELKMLPAWAVLASRSSFPISSMLFFTVRKGEACTTSMSIFSSGSWQARWPR